MRYIALLLVSVGLLSCMPSVWTAESADSTPINTICPVTGNQVDKAIPPIIITVGKGERSQKIIIGVADTTSATKVKNNPNAYVAAAKANKQAK
jgi:hypothetical protein